MFEKFRKDTLIEKEQSKLFIQRLFTRLFIDDWLMKLVALVITVTLWLGVTGLQAPTTTRLRSVPMNLLIANELEVTNAPVQDVDLVIKGDKRKIDQVIGRDLAVALDLTDLMEGDRTIQITPQNITVDLPSGVEVIGVQPDKIAVKLERLKEVEVPVRVETEGEPVAGFEVYSVRPAPNRVRISGPSSLVDAVTFVSTEKIDIADRNSDFLAQQVPLSLLNPKITLVSAATANVFVRIGKKRIERLFVVPYETENRSGRASILLFGPDSILENLTPAEIDIVEEVDSSGRIRLKTVLPGDIAGEVDIRNEKFRN